MEINLTNIAVKGLAKVLAIFPSTLPQYTANNQGSTIMLKQAESFTS